MACAANQEKLPTRHPLLIDVEQYGDVCILHCQGRFVPGPELWYMQARMDDIRRLESTKVLADFRHVASIGSMGVTFNIGIYRSVMRKPGGRFVLAGARPRVQRVLELTRLSTVIPTAPDLASGLAVLRDKIGRS